MPAIVQSAEQTAMNKQAKSLPLRCSVFSKQMEIYVIESQRVINVAKKNKAGQWDQGAERASPRR